MIVDGLKTLYWMRTGLAASRWPMERIHRRQERYLRRLLEHAYRNVPLYRRLYDEAGFKPQHFRSLNDLKRIPLLEKSDLKNTPAEQRVAQGVDPNQCEIVHTSGSTGTPLRIYLRRHDQSWQRAVAWRILFENGFRWTDRTLEIRQNFGPDFFIQRLGVAPKDWAPILDPPESWARILAEKKHEVVVASAGVLHALAEAVEQQKVDIEPPRLIISDSEALTPPTRRLIHRVLGSDPIDVYGLVELSNFAWECECRDGLHISADSHIVEVDAPPGQIGPLIATDLNMWTMPIIRYNTGDMAEMDTRPCPCGRTLPKLAAIHGREADAVVLPDGSRLFWPFFHEILARYEDLRQWKVIQEDAGSLTIRLAIAAEKVETITKIKADIAGVLPPDCELRIERVDTIPIKPTEKNRIVISRVGSGPRSRAVSEETTL